MRIRRLLAPSLGALLVLGGCTSGDAPADETPTGTQTADGTAATDDADQTGVPQPPAANGYLCRYVGPDQQGAVAGGDLAEPVQVDMQNDPTHWICEARDGEETVVRVSILRGQDLADEARDAAQAAEAVEDGPAYLGESYTSARRVTGLTMCRTPDSEGSEGWERYSIVVEAVPESDEDVAKHLTMVAGAAARALDQSVGCSPKMAVSEAVSATTAP